MATPPIFISYRKADASTEAELLFTAITNEFGRGTAFLDVKRIEGGDHWPTELEENARGAALFLVLIKDVQTWLGTEEGVRRTQNPNDWVRKEIEIALTMGKTVVPIFIDKGKMPQIGAVDSEIWKEKEFHLLQGIPVTSGKMEEAFPKIFEKIERTGAVVRRPLALSEAQDPLYRFPLPKINPFKKYKEPFIGIRYFDRDAAPLFFGRTRELLTMFNAIEQPEIRLIKLYGHSGVGKSSLLDAGVRPRLESSREVIYERRDKSVEFGVQLEKLLAKPKNSEKPRVFILDQAEEMFTDPVKGERDFFIKALERALADEPSAKFVLGFRSDYLTDLRRLLASIQAPCCDIQLDPLDRSAIIEAIEGVKKSEEKNQTCQYDLDFAADFAKKIADDLLKHETAQLCTILQNRLQKLYIAARENPKPTDPKIVLRFEDYEQLVSGAGAESELLDDAVQKILKENPGFDEKSVLHALDQFVVNKETAGAQLIADLFKPEQPLLDRAIFDALLGANLLTELRAKHAARLAHDVLAPVVRKQHQIFVERENNRLTAQNFDLLSQNLQNGFAELDFEAARQALAAAAELHPYPEVLKLAPQAFELAYVFFWAGKLAEGSQLLDIFLDLEKRRDKIYGPLPREKSAESFLQYLRSIEKDKCLDLEQVYFPTMRPIPGGAFDMGDVLGDDEYDDEKPVHRVTLSDYELAETPLTWQQFGIFCLETGFKVPNDSGWGRAARPLINVSWDDATKFCQWLSQKTGKNYRLPSEAEWEFAARAVPAPAGGGQGGGLVRFGNGKMMANPSEMNFDASEEHKKDYSEVGEYREKTTPVYQFSANALGLYDMSGNVREWCEDDWHDSYEGAPADGRAWVDSPRGAYRVRRGGSWFSYPQVCRVADRDYGAPDYRSYNIGFRLARTN